MMFFSRAWTNKALAAVLLTVLGGAAFAQEGQPAAPQPATEQPAAPAPQPAPSPYTPSHLKAARDVVELSGMSNSLEALIPQVLNRTHLTIARQRPEIAKQLEEASNAVLVQLVPQREEMLNIAASAFAKEMTEEELVAISTFFRSDAGKKYVEKQQGLVRDVLLSMQPWTDQLNRTVLTLFREELKKQGIVI